MRERPGRPALARRSSRRSGIASGAARAALEPAAAEPLGTLDYPGNVRQLKNLLEGAGRLRAGARDHARGASNPARGRTRPRPAAAAARPRRPPIRSSPTFEEFKNASEALFFRRKLAENEGNVKRTAERLGMQRSHLYKKLERYGLK